MHRYSALLAIILASVTVAAQTTPTPEREKSFTIRGRITDSTGLAMAAVVVRAKANGVRLGRAAMTDNNGFYVLSGLPIASHEVSVESVPDFDNATTQADPKGDRTDYVVDFRMKVTSIGYPGGITAGFEPDPSAESALEKRRKQDAAEKLVEQLWGLPLQRARLGPRAKSSMVELRQRQILEALHFAGTEYAVPALLLGLKDSEPLMRRNAALVLLDLCGGMTINEALDCREALPGLNQALIDQDDVVTTRVRAIIDGIRQDRDSK